MTSLCDDSNGVGDERDQGKGACNRGYDFPKKPDDGAGKGALIQLQKP